MEPLPYVRTLPGRPDLQHEEEIDKLEVFMSSKRSQFFVESKILEEVSIFQEIVAHSDEMRVIYISGRQIMSESWKCCTSQDFWISSLQLIGNPAIGETTYQHWCG